MKKSVVVCGIEFKNPLIAASGTFGFGREYNNFYDVSKWGGISSKGLTLEPRLGNPPPRMAETPMGMLNSVGLQNPGVEVFIEKELPFMKTLDTVIIANIAGNTPEDYEKMAGKLSDTDIDMLELNISCPNVKQGGIAFGIYPESVFNIVKRVKKYSKKPLMVKLSPNVASIADNAKAAEDGGADCLSLINTVTGMAVDYRTKRPILTAVTGGLSGPAVKPIALRMVWQAYNAVKIPIIGMGGITSGKDVLEFMICGASAVQIGTYNFVNPNAVIDIDRDLTKLMQECNIQELSQIVGSLQYGERLC